MQTSKLALFLTAAWAYRGGLSPSSPPLKSPLGTGAFFKSKSSVPFPQFFPTTSQHGIQHCIVDYTVSKEALRLFITESLPYPEKCHPQGRHKFPSLEDAEFGECMLNVGVLPKDIVDERGMVRCLVLNPVQVIIDEPDPSGWEEVRL